jgi:hypothetical protein
LVRKRAYAAGLVRLAICSMSYLTIRLRNWRASSALGIARRFSALAAAIVVIWVMLAIMIDRMPALDVSGWIENIGRTVGSQFLGSEH